MSEAETLTHLAAFTASLECVAARCEDVVPPVYAALFEAYPELEKLFVLDIDHGARGHMLNEALGMAEGLLAADPMAHNFVASERMNHAGYGIDDEVFEGFYTVMAEVFRSLAGEAWTEPMSAAWKQVVSLAAEARF
ncbi:MAG: globin domain-containing protein [Pseudomonadota bacterium]